MSSATSNPSSASSRFSKFTFRLTALVCIDLAPSHIPFCALIQLILIGIARPWLAYTLIARGQHTSAECDLFNRPNTRLMLMPSLVRDGKQLVDFFLKRYVCLVRCVIVLDVNAGIAYRYMRCWGCAKFLGQMVASCKHCSHCNGLSFSLIDFCRNVTLGLDGLRIGRCLCTLNYFTLSYISKRLLLLNNSAAILEQIT